MGMVKLAAPLSFLRDILVILFASLVPIGLGVMGVVWAAPIADAAAFIVTAPIMVWIYMKLKRMEKDMPLEKSPVLSDMAEQE